MTLFKQLSVLITVLVLIAFNAIFFYQIGEARNALQTDAQARAQIAAASLANGLSAYIHNEGDPTLRTISDAVFETGFYRQIKVTNVYEKVVLELKNDKAIEGVPAWFVGVFPIEAQHAESQVASGWKYAGLVNVTTYPALLYPKLYQQAKSALYSQSVAVLLLIAGLLAGLRFMLKPLQEISEAALAIADGHYQHIAVAPRGREAENIAYALNQMSRKLSDVAAALNVKLSSLGKKLQLDHSTGLYNKNTFDADLKQLYLGYIGGFLFLIKIDSLTCLVKERGNDAIDAFLKQCAEQLQKTARNFSNETSAYHFYGAKFAVLARNIEAAQARKLAKCLSMTLNELGHAVLCSDIGHIGVVAVDPMSPAEGVLPAALEAYEQAAIIGPNSYFIRGGEEPAKPIDEWRALVFEAVENRSYHIRLIDPITRFSDRRVWIEEAFIQAADKKGALLPVGPFISIAEKYEKIVDLDQGVLEQAIDYLQGAAGELHIAVNLSTRTVKNSGFRLWFARFIKQHSAVAPRLILSFSAYALAKDINAYYEFIKFVRVFGVKVMLKRFDGGLLNLEKLKTIRPDFVRVSRELSNGLREDAQKIAYLQTVKEVGDLLDIAVLAENVQDDRDFDAIKDIGLSGASR